MVLWISLYLRSNTSKVPTCMNGEGKETVGTTGWKTDWPFTGQADWFYGQGTDLELGWHGMSGIPSDGTQGAGIHWAPQSTKLR